MNSSASYREHVVAPFVDGLLRPLTAEKNIQVINPSTGRPLMSISAGTASDVDLAVASARRAFDDGRWANTPPSFRKRTLHRLADLITEEASMLDELDAEEMGKPVRTPV